MRQKLLDKIIQEVKLNSISEVDVRLTDKELDYVTTHLMTYFDIG